MTTAPMVQSLQQATTQCFHCGSPMPANNPLTVQAENAEQPVCCVGCRAAVLFLQEHGLDDYYRLREQPTGRRPGEGQAASPWFAEPDVAAAFLQPDSSDRVRVTLSLDGAHCAACAWVLEHCLAEMPDLEQVRVDLAQGRLHVTWHRQGLAADRATSARHLGALLERINGLGFDAVPARPDQELALQERQRVRSLQAIGIAGIGSMQVMMLAIADYAGWFSGMALDQRALLIWGQMVLTSVVVLWAARGFFIAAWATVRAGRVGIDVPVSLAIGLGWGVSTLVVLSGGIERGEHVYFDSVAMFTFFLLLGRHLEQSTRHRIARADADFRALLPASVVRITDEGDEEAVLPLQLQAGERIRIPPGGTVPADTRLLGDTSATVDCAALTGESALVTVTPGEPIAAGSRNAGHALLLQVIRPAEQSALAAMPALVERARQQRPQVLHLADRAAAVLVVIVLGVAAVTAMTWWWLDPAQVLPITLATLMVTCPCAFALATPVTMTAAGIRLRRLGTVLTDGRALERARDLTGVCFDKTGTLTEPRSLRCEPAGDWSEQQVLRVAAALEADVPHPLADVFRSNLDPAGPVASKVQLHEGLGVSGELEGSQWRLGRPDWAGSGSTEQESGWIHLSRDGVFCARFQVEERLRPDAQATVQALRAQGLKLAILSGDHPDRVARIARQLDIDDWEGALSPAAKQAQLQRRRQASPGLMYVGDGLNDAPVLGGADLAVVMASACDFTRASADAVVLDNRLLAVRELLAVATRTRRIVRQNLAWALSYNALAMPLAVTGWIAPWAAAIGMSASSLLVLGNALRLLRSSPERHADSEEVQPAWT